MKWFKHKTNGRRGNRIQYVLQDLGFHKGYSLFFRLMEMCAERYEGGETLFRLSEAELMAELSIQRPGVDLMMNSLQRHNLLAANRDNEYRTIWIVQWPEIAEIADEYTIKKKRKSGHVSGECPQGVRLEKSRVDKIRLDKNIVAKATATEVQESTSVAATFNAKSLDEVLKAIGKKKHDQWLDLYENESDWIFREFKKAWQYYFDNSRKKPKSIRGWKLALNSWLERGWVYRSKQVNSEFVTSKAEHYRDMAKKIAEGGL